MHGEPLLGRGGFTLMELVLVLLIAGILMAIVVPTFASLSRNARLNTAARELVGYFEKARMEAVKRNTDVAMKFSTSGNGFCEIFVDDGSGGGTAKNSQRDGTELRLDTMIMPNGTQLYEADFGSGAKSTRFSARGLPARIGSVRLKNSGKYFRASLSLAGCVTLSASHDTPL